MQTANKQVVTYDCSESPFVIEGGSALLKPINHTSPHVSNTKTVRTSNVVRVDLETGEIETLNTIYKPNGPVKITLHNPSRNN